MQLRFCRYISKPYSDLRNDSDLAQDQTFYTEILAKKQEFEDLTDEEQEARTEYTDNGLNVPLTLEEVAKAIDRSKMHKPFLKYQMRL